ncbi:Branched-chain amino acid aminotransferase [Bacillus cereus]|nr:Branched-chain amino acid aminotransferase [Bacillus cereus]
MGNQYIYMNGEFVEKEKAVVSVYDHGFYTETVYLKGFVVTEEMYFV